MLVGGLISHGNEKNKHRSKAAVMQKEALAAKRGREPHDSSREPNCPPPQVALARSSKAHLGPTSHHCRCEQLSGMQSYGNRRTKPESKCLGEQNTPPHRSRRQALSPKLTRWFLHRCPPKRGNELQKRQLLLQIISSPTRRSRRFFLFKRMSWSMLA